MKGTLKYIGMRILLLLPVLFGVSLVVFGLFFLVPGDIVDIMMGDDGLSSPAAMEQLRKNLALDQPFHIQYGRWLFNAMRGDLGYSMASRANVTQMIKRRVTVNLEMTLVAMFFVVVIGIPIGIISAYKQFSWFDHIIRSLTTLGYSIPNFWAATMVVLLGSIYFQWLPILEYVPFRVDPFQSIKFMLVPGLVLGLSTMAYIVRMTRSASLDVLRQDYVRTARSKGLAEQGVLFFHVLKNTLIPVVTALGFQMGSMFGGFVLTEHVFMLDGMGSLVLLSIQHRDLITVAGSILFLAAIFVILNLIVDIIYLFLDPRIRY